MCKFVNIAIIGDYNFKIKSHNQTNAVFRHCEDHFEFGINTFWINSSELKDNIDDKLKKYSAVYLANGPYKHPYAILKAIKQIREANIPFLATDKTYKFVLIDLFEHVIGFRAIKPDVDMQNQKLNIHNLVEQKLVYFDEGSQIYDCYGRRTSFEYTSEAFQLDPNFAHNLKEKGVNFSGSDDQQFIQAMEYANNSFFISTMFNPILSSTVAMPHPLLTGLIHFAMETKKKETEADFAHVG